MAGDETSLGDQIAGVQRLGTEAEVGGGDGAGLLRVIDEVALGEVIGLLTDDFDGVLVGADGAVGSEAVEEGADGAFDFGGVLGVLIQRGVGDIVFDADGEVVLGIGLEQFIVHALYHGGGELFGGESITPADDFEGAAGFGEGRDHVAVEGLSRGSGFFGAVQDG